MARNLLPSLMSYSRGRTGAGSLSAAERQRYLDDHLASVAEIEAEKERLGAEAAARVAGAVRERDRKGRQK